MKISMLAILMMLVFALGAGCKKDPDRSRTAPVESNQAGPAVEPADEFACRSDAECEITCNIDGECCAEPCPPCSHAYHKNKVRKMRDERRKSCKGKAESPECNPPVGCAEPQHDFVPRCEQGACTAVKAPLFSPRKEGYACKADLDCVVSCEQPNACCPSPCFCNAVYHKDELAEMQANAALRCSDEIREGCVKARCAPSKYYTVAVCEKQRCVGKERQRE